MPFVLSLLFSSLIGLMHWLIPGSEAVALPITLGSTVHLFQSDQPAIIQSAIPAAIPGFKKAFAGTSPALGVKDGQLSPCPQSPNCVVSQGDKIDAEHKIAPIEYEGDRTSTRDTLLTILSNLSRTEIVAETDDYIRIAATSRLMGFVDDAEFYFPDYESVIHVRSASRLGESDLGVNRDRIEQIRTAMQSVAETMAEDELAATEYPKS